MVISYLTEQTKFGTLLFERQEMTSLASSIQLNETDLCDIFLAGIKLEKNLLSYGKWNLELVLSILSIGGGSFRTVLIFFAFQYFLTFSFFSLS